MKRLFATLLVLVLLVCGAYAHNGMDHVIGTIAGVTTTSITVTTTDGKTQVVAITAATKYTRMDAPITLKDLKPGDPIVIHATKKDDKRTAATVKVGKGKMQGMRNDTGRQTTPSR